MGGGEYGQREVALGEMHALFAGQDSHHRDTTALTCAIVSKASWHGARKVEGSRAHCFKHTPMACSHSLRARVVPFSTSKADSASSTTIPTSRGSVELG